jgi:hypothetical protein
MTAYVAANWPVFLIVAGGLVLLISATGFARWWHQDGQHAARADGDEDRQTIVWLARIRPRPLADARIRVAALTAAIGTAGRPDGVPWADADQFLPAWPAASISDIETPLSFARELYPQTLPPLPDLHPGWPGHSGDVPDKIVRFDGELTAEQVEEYKQSFLAAVESGAHPAVLPIEDEPSPDAQPGTHARMAWLSQTADPADAGHLQRLWADDTGSFAAICAGDL